jgi:hypothetical protein
MNEPPVPQKPRVQVADSDAVAESTLFVRLLARSNASLKDYLGLRSALTHGRLEVLTSCAAMCAALPPNDEPVIPDAHAQHDSYGVQHLSD